MFADHEHDADFQDFEDDNDSEFNQSGSGWVPSDDDPFEEDPYAQNEADTEIENAFYAAFYGKEEGRDCALQSFLKVIELIDTHKKSAGFEDSEHFRFKSLAEIVCLYFGQNEVEQTALYFDEFLVCSREDRVHQNVFNEHLRKIFNEIKKSSNSAVYDRLHGATMKHLTPSNRLWATLGIDRCHELIQNGQFAKCEQLITEIQGTLQSDGALDRSQTAKLLQVYAVRIRLTMRSMGDLAGYGRGELVDLFDATQAVMSRYSVEEMMMDNRSMSLIYECWARVHAVNHRWLESYNYFKEAFLLYQQMGHSHEKSIECLKCLLMAYMISCQHSSSPNPLSMDAVSVYSNHPQIMTMTGLVAAFENDDIFEFNRLCVRESDPFILRFLSIVQRTLQRKALCCLVASYDRIKLNYLSRKLGLSVPETERLTVGLIGDGELKGRLDQIHSTLILKEKEKENDLLFTSMSQWLRSVDALRDALNGRAVDHVHKASVSDYGFGQRHAMGVAFDDDFEYAHDREIYSIF